MSGTVAKPMTDFVLKRSQFIESLDLTVEEYVHERTGAQHFHFVTDQMENVFMVAFRTVPEDSTGVAHILEHTTLCGSERFPVRDPFFLMIRRSLNTFMNAFTASDYTAYPFASENRKDFQNLLEIYLDAVFFPLLDPLDFAQEGHRLEFAEANNPESELVLKGIVYNEMKGDLSAVGSLLYEATKAELFPTATYHHNSGGDPKVIPDLSYDQLREFHARHYHPSNAIFMTSGNIPAIEHHSQIEQFALNKFTRAEDQVRVSLEKAFQSPNSVRKPYPVNSEDADKKCHVVMAWKLGANTNLEELIKCNLLSDVLLDTSASPLRLALENADIAVAPSPLCGLEESNLEISFFSGLEGVEETDVEKVEQLILHTLADIAEQGVDPDKIEACLHQLELTHREIGGDGYPFGLQLMFSCLSAAVHRSDPIALLDLDQVLLKVRSEIADPDFIPGLIRDFLIRNPHRVTMTLYPDKQLAGREQEELKAMLELKKESLTSQEKQQIVVQTQKLEERQSRAEPIHLLPKVDLTDVGNPRPEPKRQQREFAGGLLSQYRVGTNGLSYQQIACDLPWLTTEQQQLLQIYSQVITEIGSGDRNYLATQELQHARTGGIACYSAMRAELNQPNDFTAKFVMSSRCLDANLAVMNEILSDTFLAPKFTERHRLIDLIRQIRVRRDASIGGNGHGMAMTAAAAWFRPVPQFNHGISGLSGLLKLRTLDDALEDEAVIAELLGNLTAIAEQMTQQEKYLTLISGQEPEALDALLLPWNQSIAQSQLEAVTTPTEQFQAWRTTTQVNHCAQVFSTVPETHPDAAALTVLGGVLRNGYLHRAIREQGGAYGGGASHDQGNGLFRFYSYRDPNVDQTFDAFAESIRWIQTNPPSDELIEEAVLGVVSGIDAPGSPAGECKQHFQQNLFARSYEHRCQFRERIIHTRPDDVIRVATEYLSGESACAVITNHDQLLDSKFVDHVI